MAFLIVYGKFKDSLGKHFTHFYGCECSSNKLGEVKCDKRGKVEFSKSNTILIDFNVKVELTMNLSWLKLVHCGIPLHSHDSHQDNKNEYF